MLDSIEERAAVKKRREESLRLVAYLIAPVFLSTVGVLLVTAQGTGLPAANLWAGALVCWASAGVWLTGLFRAMWSN